MKTCISYSHRDSEFVHRLAEHLPEDPDIDVFIDMFHVAPGDSIINTIRDGIKDTD